MGAGLQQADGLREREVVSSPGEAGWQAVRDWVASHALLFSVLVAALRCDAVAGEGGIRGMGVVPADGSRDMRGAAVQKLAPSSSAPRFLLLGIAVDQYKNEADWGKLQTPCSDLRAVAQVLRQRYLFAPGDTRLLLDAEASLQGITRALGEMEGEATPEDSLIIYFAGHGSKNRDGGYWIPWDATGNPRTWLSNHELVRRIRRIESRHTLVICDSCFAGDIFLSTRSMGLDPEALHPGKLRGLYRRDSRTALTSGGSEPVKDTGVSDEHSIFAHFLLHALTRNGRPFLLPGSDDVFGHIWAGLRMNALGSPQKPQYGPVLDAGGAEGSLVLFLQESYVTEPMSVEAPRPPMPGELPAPQEEDPLNANCVLFSNPPNGLLTIQKRDLPISDAPTVYLEQGDHRFRLQVPRQPPIYGVISVHAVNDDTRSARFGMSDGVLIPDRHVRHALEGAPVRYTIELTTPRGRYKVVSYRLSLNRI